jgi:uncharacterized membrane protein YqjE
MNIPTQECHKGLAFRSLFFSVVLVSVAVLALVGLEVYVRFAINQEFAFLSGFALETLIFSTAALVLGTMHLCRSGRS